MITSGTMGFCRRRRRSRRVNLSPGQWKGGEGQECRIMMWLWFILPDMFQICDFHKYSRPNFSLNQYYYNPNHFCQRFLMWYSHLVSHLCSISLLGTAAAAAATNEVKVVYGVRIIFSIAEKETMRGDKVQIDGDSSRPRQKIDKFLFNHARARCPIVSYAEESGLHFSLIESVSIICAALGAGLSGPKSFEISIWPQLPQRAAKPASSPKFGLCISLILKWIWDALETNFDVRRL